MRRAEQFCMRRWLWTEEAEMYSAIRQHTKNNQKHKRFRHMVFVWCRREIENNNNAPDKDHVSKTLVFLIVLYVSSHRWVHFSRAVLFCHPHQQLFTHWCSLFTPLLSVWDGELIRCFTRVRFITLNHQTSRKMTWCTMPLKFTLRRFAI